MNLKLEDLLKLGFLMIILIIVFDYLKNYKITNKTNKINEPFSELSDLYELDKKRNDQIKKNLNELKNSKEDIKKTLESQDKYKKKSYILDYIESINKKINKYKDENLFEPEYNENQKVNDNDDIITKNQKTIFKLEKKLKQILKDKYIQNLKDTNVIKSMENGMRLTIVKDESDDLNNPNNQNLYRVYINNKCLKVDCDGNYSLSECKDNDKSQLFSVNQIYDKSEYENQLEKMNHSNKDFNLKKQKYPFTMLKSKVNQNCVQNNNGYISIQPCQIRNSQQWKLLNSKNICDNLYENKC